LLRVFYRDATECEYRHLHTGRGFMKEIESEWRAVSSFGRSEEYRAEDGEIGAFSFRATDFIKRVARDTDEEAGGHDLPQPRRSDGVRRQMYAVGATSQRNIDTIVD
jgi:nitroimidazol reductase NimA-like FMN-containing flavoprotein (pyridoxamine 5'-phosphate oxidase superfamily)